MPSLFPLRTLPRRAKGRILWGSPAQAIRRDVYWGRWQLRRLWRRNLPRKIDFVIAGASRSGTTALHTYLKQHPEACLADIKEVHFFDQHLNFFPPGEDYAAYHVFFSPRPEHRVIGEATPGYIYRPDVAARLHAYNPKLKLIVMLRNPIERAFSHWRWISEHGLERLPFWDALQQEETRLLMEDWQGRGNHSYADRGRYAGQLERIWRYFPREQTLILKTTDLAAMPQETLDRACAFLGISPHAFTDLRGVNTTSFEATMSQREEAYLRTIFEPEIKALEVLLGWDCGDWLQQPAVTSGV